MQDTYESHLIELLVAKLKMRWLTLNENNALKLLRNLPKTNSNIKWPFLRNNNGQHLPNRQQAPDLQN